MKDDDEEDALLIRKTSQDKLTYKNTIQNRINWCLIVMGTKAFPTSVKALEHSIIFDVQGYKFKTNLEKIHNSADELMMERENKLKEKLGRAFYKRPVQAKFKIRQEEQYWMHIFDKVMQLIADHKLLIEYDKSISIVKVGDDE